MPKIFPRIIELQGLQASGKTTLARLWLKQFPNVIRVNKDDLRAMMRGDNYKLGQEQVVKAAEAAVVSVAVEHGYSVVVDDTNLPKNNFWKDLAKRLGAEHEVKELDISVDEAIKRDAARDKPVGEIAIRATAKRVLSASRQQ